MSAHSLNFRAIRFNIAVFADVLDYLDEQEFAPSEQASRSVDALVNDIDSDSLMGLPTSGSRILEQPRRSTPTIPPGFSADEPAGLAPSPKLQAYDQLPPVLPVLVKLIGTLLHCGALLLNDAVGD